ncbi:MAG: hypothetical protein ACHQWH_01945, partial [Nitrososphaerales archaeon]
VSESKRQIENISYFGDFRSNLLSGDTISSTNVTVTVLSGTDPSPGSMLAGGYSLHNGNIIEQHIRQGVPGVIYDVTFSILSVQGNDYTTVTRLAVLPTEGNAIPIFTPLYETSTLYPYILSEAFTAYAPTISTGKLFGVVQAEDGITASLALNTSILTYQQYYYIYPLDAFTASIHIGNGVLTYQSYISYNDGPESIKTNIAMLTSTLTAATLISYSIPSDNIIASISIQNGTLV